MPWHRYPAKARDSGVLPLLPRAASRVLPVRMLLLLFTRVDEMVWKFIDEFVEGGELLSKELL